MRNKRGYLGDLQGFLNLDSLVDIVSNNVGILIILAVFMAMFSLLEKSEQVSTITSVLTTTSNSQYRTTASPINEQY